MEPQALLMSLLEACLPDLDDIPTVRQKVKYLAHYTSVDVMREICIAEKLWFSNPMFMNDLQEMIYGIERGVQLVAQCHTIHSAFQEQGKTRHENIRVLFASGQFDAYHRTFLSDHSLDVYVFCMTAHEEPRSSGVLSMWREYGDNGRGAALVFNTKFLRDKNDSLLLMAEVKYRTEEERLLAISEMIRRWQAAVIKAEIPLVYKEFYTDACIAAAMQALFVAIEILALTTKHKGFSEEREWRLIYLPEFDAKQLLTPHLSYHIGDRGVEPKLKFPIRPFDLVPRDEWNFDDILEAIILGPGMSERLNGRAMRRLLAEAGKDSFQRLLHFSDIPLRQTY